MDWVVYDTAFLEDVIESDRWSAKNNLEKYASRRFESGLKTWYGEHPEMSLQEWERLKSSHL